MSEIDILVRPGRKDPPPCEIIQLRAGTERDVEALAARVAAERDAAIAALRDRAATRARRLQDLGFPRDLPVLMLLAQDTVDESPDWLASHEEQLQDVDEHELAVLDGPHYLHWTRSPELATRITAFLGAHGIAARDGTGIDAPAAAG